MTIAYLDDCLARFQTLGLARLPPSLERAFQDDEREPRRQIALWGLALGTTFYVTLLLVDWLILDDIFWASLYIRFGIGVPISLAMIWVHRDGTRRGSTYEAAAAIVGCVDSLSISVVFASSHQLAALTYLSANLIVMGFTINLVGLSTRSAAILCALILSIMLFATALSPVSNASVIVVNALVGSMVALTCVFANYCLQTEKRRGFLTMRRDEILLRQIAEQQALLERLASLDPLTQIANRRGFDAVVESTVNRSAAGRLAVAMIDVDSFKKFNDAYGHPMGDEVLRSVARVLASTCDAAVHVGRMGGEEFAIAAIDMPIHGFLDLMEQVRRAVEELRIPHRDSDAGSVVTVSIGVTSGAAYDAGRRSALFQAADEALYVAKTSGRNRVVARGGVENGGVETTRAA